MKHYFQVLYYSFRMKKLAPFRIRGRAVIHIDGSCRLQMNGRLVIGNDKSLPVVSVMPVNLWFGKNTEVSLGHSVSMGPGVNIVVKDGASLTIGEGTYFTSDMHIEVVHKLQVGKNCAISWGTTIIDDDHHEILVGSSKSGKSEVLIGDHVWIGCNTTILKGTHIGDNCVVGANSLVKGTFPPNSLIAGNPARVVKQGVSWK